MKLSICITHYDEETSIVKDMLDSIAIQQNVDFQEIEVIMVNDGGDYSQISKIKRTDYPFKFRMSKAEHAGLSATRNKAFDKATGEFVMFCDVDDMFYTMNALNLVIQLIEAKSFDMMISSFMEAVRCRDGTSAYYKHPIDYTFVHGKVYRRQFLLENNIKFDPAVEHCEDSVFNRIALAICDPERLLRCKTPFYLWRWRDNSICRREGERDIVTSQPSFVDGVNSLVNELLRRNKLKDASYATMQLVYKIYYLINSDIFRDPKNAHYLAATELRFKQFYNKFSYLCDNVPADVKNNLARIYKETIAKKYNVVLEHITFDNWIEHIASLEVPAES